MGVHGVCQGSTTVKGRGRRYRTGLKKRRNLSARGTEPQPGQRRGSGGGIDLGIVLGHPCSVEGYGMLKEGLPTLLSAAEDVIASADLKTLY